MKNVLKLFAVVLVVSCMFVSCSKNVSSSGSSGGNSNDTDGGGSGSSGGGSGSSSAAAVSSNNSLKNAVGNIKHGKDDIIFNNWARIEWAAFGIDTVPAEPPGGKFEGAFVSAEGPFVFMSNISRAAYESICREMEAAFDKEGSITNGDYWYVSNLKLGDWDECFEISLGSKL